MACKRLTKCTTSNLMGLPRESRYRLDSYPMTKDCKSLIIQRDCHDFANAKSRNDDKTQDCHAKIRLMLIFARNDG